MRAVKRVAPEALEEELRNLPSKIAVSAASVLGCEAMLAAAREFCPVDTGALSESIRVERIGPLSTLLVAGGGGHVNPRSGREVDYAVAVHEGTSRTPPRPFLLQAVQSERLNLAREILASTAEAA